MNMFIKFSAIAFIFILILNLSSCRVFQYGNEYPEVSRFNSINSVGIAKDDFIREYGQPNHKGIEMKQDTSIERLYYTEKLKNTIVTTEFTFKNNKLSKMAISEIIGNFQPYMDSIRWEIGLLHVRIKG